jgi:LacI family transcriptional regulator
MPPPHYDMAASKHVLAHLRWSTSKLEHGIRAYAREAGWTLSFMRNADDYPLGSRKVAGVLLQSGPVPIDVRALYPCAKIVDLRSMEPHPADAYLRIDQDQIARIAADHLHGLGHRNFLGFGCKPLPPITHRLDAFKKRIAELGSEASILYSGHWPEQIVLDPDHLKKRLTTAIRRAGLPLAVFAPDDDYAMSFIQVALEMDYRIPEDIVVLGANNNRAVCETCPVPISSIDVNLARLGYEGARMLDRLMQGDTNTPQLTIIPPHGIETRASTGTPSITSKPVTAVQEYIREHFAEKITPQTVLHDLRLSRTTAFSRFKSATGRTIGQEITRVRLDQACYLLENTDYKIDAVARMSGYANTSAFCRLFRRVYQVSPAAFRVKETGNAAASFATATEPA